MDDSMGGAPAPPEARMATGGMVRDVPLTEPGPPGLVVPSDWWPPRTLWLRHGWDKDPGKREQVCEWARANGLDPVQIPDNEPFIVGRGEAGRPPTLSQGPTLTVVLAIDDPEQYEPHPGDQGAQGGPYGPIRVRRTVPLKVAPPPDLFLDIAAEVQRAAAGNPAMQAWVAEQMDPTADLAEALGHDRYEHPGRAELLAEVLRLREATSRD